MRVFQARCALALGTVTVLFLIADSAQAGPFRKRGGRGGAVVYSSASSCGYGYGYGGMAYGGVGSGGMYSGGMMPGYGQPMYYPGGGYAYGQQLMYPSGFQGYGQPLYGYPQGGILPAGYSSGYPSGLIPAGGVPGQMPGLTGETKSAKITDGSYEPKELSVPVGTTVRWTNSGNKVHTVTSTKGDWDSGDIQAGKDFSATFTKAGTFEYYCKHHPDMKGTITVK